MPAAPQASAPSLTELVPYGIMKYCFMKEKHLAAAALKLNGRLENLMPLITPVGVALGFLFSERLRGFKPIIPWLFALLTLSGSLKLRARELGAAIARPVPVLAFFVGSHVLMPLLAFAASSLAFPGKGDLVSGYVLLFSTPTAVSGFIWVSIFRGDGALALAVILLDALAAPAVVPATIKLLLGTSVSIDGAGLIASLFAMVVAPTILGVFLNESSRGRIPARVGPYIGPISKFCLLFVIGGNAAAVAPSVDLASPLVLAVAGLCVALAAAGFCIGRLFGFLPGLDDRSRRSLTFNIGLRNISAGATIAIAFFPAAAALPATLGIIFQQTLSAIMGRLLLGPPGKNEIH